MGLVYRCAHKKPRALDMPQFHNQNWNPLSTQPPWPIKMSAYAVTPEMYAAPRWLSAPHLDKSHFQDKENYISFRTRSMGA